ncbi:MAG: hypothetical protein AAGB51_05805 [Planctomycetota bacterium]
MISVSASDDSASTQAEAELAAFGKDHEYPVLSGVRAKRYEQTTGLQRELAGYVRWLSIGWLIAVLLIVFLCASDSLIFGWLIRFELADGVLIALLGTATANVLGLPYIVLKAVYNQEQDRS